MVFLLAERYDIKSNVKLGGFRSQLQASYMSNHTKELWYNETVCQLMTIYIYIYMYIVLLKETQAWLYCHHEFIFPDNIIILSVSSDDCTCLTWVCKTENMDYSLYVYRKKERKADMNFKFSGDSKGFKTIKY